MQAAADRGTPLMEWTQPAFWLAAWQIILINVVLSGDNAVVIALACRTLPPRQRLWGMVFGAGAAVVLRIIFTLVVTTVMGLPYLKLIGGLLLLWIAVKLVMPSASHGEDSVKAGDNLLKAIQIVAIADIVMSLDNVIAIAAAAKGSWALIIFGLVVSVPMIVAGSAVLMSWMESFPILVWGGAALLGRVAGEIMSEDPVVIAWLGETAAHHAHAWALHIGAIFVVAVGLFFVLRQRSLAGDERMAMPGLLLWIAGEVLIKLSFPPEYTYTRLAGYAVLALALGFAYRYLRRRRSAKPGLLAEAPETAAKVRETVEKITPTG
jgi:YjbE family integral membrane protein